MVVGTSSKKQKKKKETEEFNSEIKEKSETAHAIEYVKKGKER